MEKTTAGNQTILVTGATGFVGRRLADRALADGYRVRTITRREWDGSPNVAMENRFLGRMPYLIPREAFTGVRFAIHCAAYAGNSEKVARAVNVEGTLRLANLAREAGVRAFVFVSSSSAREDAGSAYGRSKWEAERRLLELTGMDVVVVRPNLVTGPGYSGVFGRMRRTVERLPVIPLLGGGKSLVQPIHVDDLARALLRCGDRAADFKGSILSLGMPEAMTLAELLGKLSLSATGRRKSALSIPIWPVELALGVAETLRIPTPFGRANLMGLRLMEKADTGKDLARLGLELKDPFAPDPSVPGMPDRPLPERPVRILLVGAGRIGLVHAVTLSRMKGMVLSGMVDGKRGAIALIRRLGVDVPGWGSIGDALDAVHPDAVIVATPTASHLPLASECASNGLSVLVEKPVALGPAQLDEYVRLAGRYPGRLLGGWVLARNPHVTDCLARLRKGEYGTIRGFTAFSLMSFVMGKGFRRWETSKAAAGGGAYLTAGGHALSMVHAAFGEPRTVASQSVRLHSDEVEDSFVAEYEYPGFRGVHYCSWSIPGYQRLESVLVVETADGRLTLSPAAGIFEKVDGTVSVVHQLDFDCGFNMAPDYAGAGFAVEYGDLGRAAQGCPQGGADITNAISLERVLARAYAGARSAGSFVPPAFAGQSFRGISGDGMAPDSSGRGIRRILDLRGCANEVARAVMRESGDREWDGVQILPGQYYAAAPSPERIRVTVPDFSGQTRLIFSGRLGELVRGMGVAGMAEAFKEALRSLPREGGATFWAAAAVLTRAGLASLPRDFPGVVLLHGQLADLALAVGRYDRLDGLLAYCRIRCPQARIGFHSGMAAEAVNVVSLLKTPVDDLSVMTSPGWQDEFEVFRLAHGVLANGVRITAETGEAPAALHRLATVRPEMWAHGSELLLVGAAADSGVAAGLAEKRTREWVRAFPGIPAPTFPF